MQDRIALIDADSIVYIVAWHHKDSEEFFVLSAVDSLVRDILKNSEATRYLGFLSSPTNFRNSVYKYAVYKGNRPPKPEWVVQWESTIKLHLSTVWGFHTVTDLEADDCLSLYAYSRSKITGPGPVLCSPDKDIRNIPGLHYDYKTQERGVFSVSPEEASRSYYIQLLTGDTTDNIKGLPGIGPDKAEKLLPKGMDWLDMDVVVSGQYRKAFGDYYGPIILKETESVVGLMSFAHPCFKEDYYVVGRFEPLPAPNPYEDQ